jgi:hypothetical protein
VIFNQKKKKRPEKEKFNHSLVPLSYTSKTLSMSISKPCPMDLDQNHLIFSTHSLAVVNAIKFHFRGYSGPMRSVGWITRQGGCQW